VLTFFCFFFLFVLCVDSYQSSGGSIPSSSFSSTTSSSSSSSSHPSHFHSSYRSSISSSVGAGSHTQMLTYEVDIGIDDNSLSYTEEEAAARHKFMATMETDVTQVKGNNNT
jgi:hypothetical protein